MGLEEFERELAAEKAARDEKKSDDKHRHHHRSSRHDDSHRSNRHGQKRSRHSEHRDHKEHGRYKEHRRHRDHDDRHHDDRHRSKRARSGSPEKPSNIEAEEEWVEKDTVQRDSWMQAPSSLDIDYLQRSRVKKSPPSQFVTAKENHEKKLHQHEIDLLEKDLADDNEEESHVPVKDEPAQHQVSYTFGDSGSQWRMSKLRNVYRQAKEDGKAVEEIALERYGDLREFDDAREEERELDRRERYGKNYVGLEKPSGELFQERKMAAGIRRGSVADSHGDAEVKALAQGTIVPQPQSLSTTVPLDQTSLNKLKAKIMKAKLRNDTDLVTTLETEYNAALAASGNSTQSDVVVLSNMDNRMLAGGRGGEVTAITNKRGLERGTVEENEDMSIEDMVRAERRSRGTNRGNEGLILAERIAKDGKFDNDLDYMDDNANKLAKRVAKSDFALRNTAVGEFQKMQKILDACPLCHHEDRNEPPQAPLISLGTRTYLTLHTEPELVRYGAVIVPIQHRLNLLECDDDEWEEMRNFQKALTRFYQSMDKGVVFYENAAEPGRKRHAALVAVPLSWGLHDAAPGFFKEAILQADEEWAQHRKIIDTAKMAREKFGKGAFRKSMVKEMPYFHVWFGLDGGLGHIVEDERRWPKGDLFAREVIGGMLDRGPETIKRQGRWTRKDHRIEGFRKRWDGFDWTKVLMDAQ